MSIPRLRPTPALYVVSVLILVLLTLWGFAPLLEFDFLTPETWHGIQDLSGRHVLVVQSGERGRLGQPVPLVTTFFTLLLDRTFWGSNALGYHVTNLLLHLLGGLMVVLIFYELSGDWLLAMAVGLLYSVHPLHLQTVAPVTARSELVYSILFLGAFLSYLKSRGSPKLLGLAVVLYLLTLLEKPAAVGFGLLILAYDRLFLEAKHRSRRLPWVLLGISLLLVGFFHLTGRLQSPGSAYKGDLLSVLLSGAANLGGYLQVLFWPTRSTFGLDLAVPPSWLGVAGLAGYLAVLGLLWRMTRSGSQVWKLMLFGAIWFGLTLFAEVNVLYANLNLFAASHLSLAMLGCLLLLLVPLRALLGGRAGGMLALIVLTLVLSVGLTWVTSKRSVLWKDANTLWQDVLDRDQQNYWASYHLSLYYAWKNREEFRSRQMSQNLERSLTAIQQAIESSSSGRYVFQERNYLHRAKLRSQAASNDRAEICLSVLDPDERLVQLKAISQRILQPALRDCQQAREIYERHKKEGFYQDKDEERLTESNLETMLGTLYERQATFFPGKTDKAVLDRALVHFRKALALSETPMTLTNLAKVLVDLGQEKEATEVLGRALELHPESEVAYTRRGTLAFRNKQWADAIQYFQLGLDRARFPAAKADLRVRLAKVYSNLGQHRVAELHWEAVLQIDPGHYEASWELVGRYINSRRWQEAIRQLNTLALHHPKAQNPRTKLAEIYLKMGDSQLDRLGQQIIAKRNPPRSGPVNDIELVNAAGRDPEVLARLQQVSTCYRKALTAKPKDPVARRRFAMMYYFEAIGMLMVGNLKGGIGQMARVIKHFPEYTPAAAMIRGTVQLLVHQGEWKKIHQVIKQAAGQNPDNKLLTSLDAQLELHAAQERQHPRLVREAQARLRSNPRDHKANWLVGNHLAKKGKEQEANEHYRLALMNFPLDELQMRTNFDKEYIGWLIRWARRARLRVMDGKQPERNQQLFNAYLSKAMGLIKPHYEKAPAHPEYANNLALIYQMAKQHTKGILVLRGVKSLEAHHKQLLADLLYRRSLRGKRGVEARCTDLKEAILILGPGAPAKYKLTLSMLQGKAALIRAQRLFAEGKLEDARQLLVESGSSDYAVQLMLGRIYARQQKLRQAFSHLAMAAARSPNHPDGLYHLGRTCERMGQRQLANALLWYDRFIALHRKIERNPVEYKFSDPDLQRWKGWASEVEKRREGLRKSYIKSFQLGLTHYRAKRFEEAGKAFRTCLWIRPKAVEARYYLGVCLAETQQTEAAVKQLRQVVMRDSDNALAHFRLGVLYYGYGRDRYADATKHLLRAVKLDPGSKVSEIAKRYLDVMRKGSGK